MSTPTERILLVESDPEISDLIARQALQPLGYRVKVIADATRAIQDAAKLGPDVMIVNLNLPGLSGKDLLVALASQGIQMPIIVVAEQGMEADVIQAFRLGASDYLRWPIRETEVVSAVERALKQVRAGREREHLARQVRKTNEELQNRVRELTTILSIGKVVTSTTDRRALFDKLMEGAVFISQADKGWLLLRENGGKNLVLSSQRNLPKSIAKKQGQPWDDGISSLVALSGETLAIHGEPLKRFKVSRLGHSVLVVPVKAHKEVLGILVVVREAARPFDAGNQKLLEALADYASISLVNVSLFQAVEERALSLQRMSEVSHKNEQFIADLLKHVGQELQAPLVMISQEVDLLTEDGDSSLKEQQRRSVRIIRREIKKGTRVVAALSLLAKASLPPNLATLNLSELATQAKERFQNQAKEKNITIQLALPDSPAFITADMNQVGQVLDALLSNALRFSEQGNVVIRVETDKKGLPKCSIDDSGPGISKEHQSKIFLPFYKVDSESGDSHDGLGIGLALAAEIIKAHGGDLWVESQPQKGSTFCFTLQPMR